MATEIQRIPGSFSLPADWPKVEFPDINSNLLFDWRADDLPLGDIAQPWLDRVSGQALTAMSGGSWQSIPVINAGSGHKAAQFRGASRLRIDHTLPQELTMCFVYRHREAGNSGGRLASGSDSYRTVMAGTGESLNTNVAVNSSNVLGQALIPGVKLETWQSATVSFATGRGDNSKIIGQVLGGPTTEQKILPEVMPPQAVLYIGFNPTSPGGTNSATVGYKGDIARIMVWGRGLSPIDVRAANRAQQLQYPNLL